MDVPREWWWRGPRARRGLIWATLALVAALLAPRAKAAEEPGTLKLSCEGSTLSLEARDAPATAVLRALEKECGLILEGKEYIPERPVTVAYQKVTLEEVIESLIRLTGLPSTMLAVASSGALKLAVLATGTPSAESMSMINGGWPTALSAFGIDEGRAEEAALEDARRQFLLAKTYDEQQRALAELKNLDPDEAWIFEVSTAEEMAVERTEAEAEAARRRFFLAQTELGRRVALKELERLDPEEAQDLGELSDEELTEEEMEAALDEAWDRVLLAETNEEMEQALEEVKRLDPDEEF